MNTKLALSGAALLLAAGAASAQQTTGFDVQAAAALLHQMNASCLGGSKSKACGVLVYSPEDCGKKKDPYTVQVYNTYNDGTVRYQAGTQIRRTSLGGPMARFGVFDSKGETVQHANPVFVSWSDYESGQRTVPVCGKNARVKAADYIISTQVQAFLKANP